MCHPFARAFVALFVTGCIPEISLVDDAGTQSDAPSIHSVDSSPGDATDEVCRGWLLVGELDSCLIDAAGREGLLVLDEGPYVYDTEADTLDLSKDEIAHYSLLVERAGGETPVRVVSAETIQIWSPLRVRGHYPLVLVAWGNLMIADLVDASSGRGGVGPGGNESACDRADPGGDDMLGVGGGGGGGGLGSPGGEGGPAGGAANGGLPGGGATQVRFRGGCSGGAGGVGADSGGSASAGAGGGAIGFMARGRLTVLGGVHAGGGGGDGADGTGGGGGGGSGGFIWMEGMEGVGLNAAAILVANGGGGGQGGDGVDPGDPGDDAPANGDLAEGGDDSESNAGYGGDGSFGKKLPISGEEGLDSESAGGGGGGGAGIIVLDPKAEGRPFVLSPPPRDPADIQ